LYEDQEMWGGGGGVKQGVTQGPRRVLKRVAPVRQNSRGRKRSYCRGNNSRGGVGQAKREKKTLYRE